MDCFPNAHFVELRVYITHSVRIFFVCARTSTIRVLVHDFCVPSDLISLSPFFPRVGGGRKWYKSSSLNTVVNLPCWLANNCNNSSQEWDRCALATKQQRRDLFFDEISHACFSFRFHRFQRLSNSSRLGNSSMVDKR